MLPTGALEMVGDYARRKLAPAKPKPRPPVNPLPESVVTEYLLDDTNHLAYMREKRQEIYDAQNLGVQRLPGVSNEELIQEWNEAIARHQYREQFIQRYFSTGIP